MSEVVIRQLSDIMISNSTTQNSNSNQYKWEWTVLCIHDCFNDDNNYFDLWNCLEQKRTGILSVVHLSHNWKLNHFVFHCSGALNEFCIVGTYYSRFKMDHSLLMHLVYFRYPISNWRIFFYQRKEIPDWLSQITAFKAI